MGVVPTSSGNFSIRNAARVTEVILLWAIIAGTAKSPCPYTERDPNHFRRTISVLVGKVRVSPGVKRFTAEGPLVSSSLNPTFGSCRACVLHRWGSARKGQPRMFLLLHHVPFKYQFLQEQSRGTNRKSKYSIVVEEQRRYTLHITNNTCFCICTDDGCLRGPSSASF